MLSLSLPVCRRVMCSFRLMFCDFPRRKSEIKYNKIAGPPPKLSNERSDTTRQGLSFATKYLKQVDNPEEIQWDWMTKKLEGLKMNNIPTKILQACIRLDELDLGLRYYNYLVEKGVKLSPVDLIFFSKLLSLKKSEITKHEELLKLLYNDIKEFLQSSALMRQFLMEVFVEIPSCFKDIVERGRHPTVRGVYMPVVKKALELNMPEVAFEFMNDSDFCVNTSFLEQYVNFCIKRAEEGKFSVDLINRLINKCVKTAIPVSHENPLKPLSTLVSVLNKHHSYQWSVDECELNRKEECSICGSTLLPNGITDDEFAQLKEHFFRQSFIESDVFLSSTRTELKRFLEFLQITKPYTLVLDGLNMIYRNKHCGSEVDNRSVKYFLDKGYHILIIGRIHSKKILATKNLLTHPKYRSQAQFFFTSNLSDDDLFLLYATLHGGPDTFFVTGDHLSKYAVRLDDHMKYMFLKWQLSHQYLITSGLQLFPPRSHCGLPQLTVNNENQYIWHIGQQIGNHAKLHISCPTNWYCLSAKKKKDA